MASTNQSPFYQKAEAMFLQAKTNEDKLKYLEEMIRECPKHKSSEKMLAQLKTRRKKLLEKVQKAKKASKASGKQGIKKADMQAVIVGFTNSGKSTLLSLLTNTSPEIASYNFTTKIPIVGMIPFSGVQIQLIEVPAVESEYYDRGIVHTADTILIVVNNLEDISKIQEQIKSEPGKKIIVYNLSQSDNMRKITATLLSRKYNFVAINLKNKDNLEDLKEKIFQSFNKIRVFMKEPGKTADKNRPLVLSQGSTVEDAAEKILHGFSKNLQDAFITGPSSKFPNQRVGLKHELKDMDIVEFRTK